MPDKLIQYIECIGFIKVNLMMIGLEEVCHDLGVTDINRIMIEPDGKKL